jgi:hypothetical protein
MVSLRNKTSILLLFVTVMSGLAFGRDHSRDYGELRDIVDRTQKDLRAASGLEHGDKQRARVQHAQDDLSKLDRKLVKGKFDNSAMQQSRSALKSILDHNTLPVSGRDALMRDLADLQAARERR